MSLRNNNPNSVINGRCSIAIVERVYLQDVVDGGKLVIQKYSISRKLKGKRGAIIRRSNGSNKFVQLPKIGQYVYVESNENGYFWDKRNDLSSKSNLGLDFSLGSTVITGSNHDIILLNGRDDRSMMLISSVATKDRKKFVNLKVNGEGGILSMMSSDGAFIVSKSFGVSVSDFVNVTANKGLRLYRKGNVKVIRTDGLTVSNDQDGKNAQPMVLGGKLKKWQQDFASRVKDLVDNLVTNAQTRIRGRGPTGPAARATFKATMTPLIRSAFLSNKTDLVNILSKKNKAD